MDNVSECLPLNGGGLAAMSHCQSVFVLLFSSVTPGKLSKSLGRQMLFTCKLSRQ